MLTNPDTHLRLMTLLFTLGCGLEVRTSRSAHGTHEKFLFFKQWETHSLQDRCAIIMKTSKKFAMVILGLVTIGHSGSSQGFVNLNFEHPILPLTPDEFRAVPITNALPGWTGYLYGSPVDRVAFNGLSLGGAQISLQNSNGFPPIQGNYSVLLQGSTPSFQGSAAVGQTGQIPADALSLRFWGGISQVSFKGQIIPHMAIGAGPNYTIYGGDISAFSGQTGELLFTAFPSRFWVLDNIQFSTEAIPEPRSLGLFALGGLLFGLRRWRNSSR